MLVYVLNKYGKPLMPCKPSKARKLLKQNKAKVIKKEPFTIKLLYGSSGRSTGYFDLRKLDGTKIHNSASYKKMKLLETRKGYLTERRIALSPTT